jgi:hypothetical protein
MNKSIIIAVLCGIMSGCNPFYPLRPDTQHLQSRGWAPNPNVTKSSPPLYCYGTLADRMCYTTPLVGKEDRLEGAYYPKIDIMDDRTRFDEMMNDFGY